MDRSEVRRVLYDGEEIGARLREIAAGWQIAPVATGLCLEGPGETVIVTDGRCQKAEALRAAVEQNLLRIICVAGTANAPGRLPSFAAIEAPATLPILRQMIDAAFENMALARRQGALERELERTRSDIGLLNEIGAALSSERDRASLLDLILQKSRDITRSDAGSLYLVEEAEGGEKRLRFVAAQNDSVSFSYREVALPIDDSSMAGYVALTGEELHIEDVYRIPASLPFRFHRKFDQESGYRTKSVLAVPMKNPQGEIIGVVQPINCKRDPRARAAPGSADDEPIPYPEECRTLLGSVASQAAVAIENNRLYESIETLFEGFVKASVSAIEARDPATSGHSFRVADMTLRLAAALDRDDSAAFRAVRFSRAETKEIRYASLLHDFGKVGVRERVLVKAKKLYPEQLELLKQRCAYARKALEHEHSERRLAYLLDKGRDEYLAREGEFRRELDAALRDLDEFLQFVVRCNEPTVLREGNFERLMELGARHYVDESGRSRPLLTEREVRLLSIAKGTLDEEERRHIENHVTHTLNFLRQIPWTREIKNIPIIASAHHEKLDRSGYPAGLAASEIPLQSKMMTVSDIFDALAASDRPYKKAVPWDRALDILSDEAAGGLIDADLLRLFRAAEVYRPLPGRPAS